MDYHEYLESEEWKIKREWVLIFWRNRCALCDSDANIQVHHRTYERVGHELLTDLLPLCQKCHTRHHGMPESPAHMPAFLETTSQKIKAGIP